MTTNRNRWTTVLVAGMMILLPLLAGLQYRWIGRLSESEATRLRTTLRAGTLRFAEDFDRTLEAAYRAFQFEVRTDGTPSALHDALRRAYARWQSDAAHPNLFEALYLVTPTDDGPRLARLARLDSLGLTPLPWPARFADWHAHFARHPDLGDPPTDPFALALPLAHLVDRPGGLPEARVEYVLLPLDVDYLATTFFPERARAYFTDGETRTHDLLLLDPAHPDRILFRTDPALTLEDFATPDASARIGRVPHTRLSLTSESATEVTKITQRNEVRERIEVDRVPGDAGAGVRGPTVVVERRAEMTEGPAAAWEVRVRHRGGSLASVVAGQRTRNLALSFGILLLLGGAMGLIYVSAQRARRLAAQQMAFVAGVSHELRTPLAVIQSAAENLADGVVRDAEGTHRYGTLIRDEVRRLSAMVEQALALAGAQSGRQPYRFAPVAVAALVERSLATLAPEIALAGAQVTTALPADLPPIRGDAAALEAALGNLLGNALKYGGADGPLHLSANATDGPTPEVHLAVHDHGPGIPADEQPHLFEPFFRGRHALDAQMPGSGLGLSLVWHTAEAHGGRVTVTSTPGAGSVFTLHLPAEG